MTELQRRASKGIYLNLKGIMRMIFYAEEHNPTMLMKYAMILRDARHAMRDISTKHSDGEG